MERCFREPDPQWYDQLNKNRPDSKIITKCIWKKTGETLDFLSSENGVLSTINSFRYSDKDSMSENSKLRNKKFKNFKIDSISLNDLVREEFNNIAPSYISVDTEGSEYEILNNFDFKKYQPIFFTVEHNYTSNQKSIDELMILHMLMVVRNQMNAILMKKIRIFSLLKKRIKMVQVQYVKKYKPLILRNGNTVDYFHNIILFIFTVYQTGLKLVVSLKLNT